MDNLTLLEILYGIRDENLSDLIRTITKEIPSYALVDSAFCLVRKTSAVNLCAEIHPEYFSADLRKIVIALSVAAHYDILCAQTSKSLDVATQLSLIRFKFRVSRSPNYKYFSTVRPL